MEVQHFENEYVSFELRDGILFGRYKVTKLNLAIAQSGTAFRIEVMEGKKVPAVADISVIKEIDKDARQFISSPEAGKDLSALAIIIKNPVSRIIWNFQVKFNPPEYLLRFFSNEEEAIQWIKKIV